MTAFKDVDYALLIGSRPRGPGMERAELLAVNAEIFTAQGKALNAVASDPMLQTLLLQRAGRGQGTLLTPHPLEAARLLACTAAEVQQDRLKAAGRLAAHFQATVLLKGSGTVVQATGRRPTINPTGNAALATAGTGDVLAGWAAGLWAQQPRADARKVAAAAWQHGAAADRHALRQPGRALRAADLVEALIGRD
jgi:hydroxyethylthiazole kinase-like uncharacterized protein yjeF